MSTCSSPDRCCFQGCQHWSLFCMVRMKVTALAPVLTFTLLVWGLCPVSWLLYLNSRSNCSSAGTHKNSLSHLFAQCRLRSFLWRLIKEGPLAIGLRACVLSHFSHVHSPPDSSVHGIFQARILEWVAMPFSRGSSPPRYQPPSLISLVLASRFFATGTT